MASIVVTERHGTLRHEAVFLLAEGYPMSLDLGTAPAWLPLVLLAEDDTEERVSGSDLHQQAIGECYAPLYDHAAEIGSPGRPAWYVSSQVTIIVPLPRRERP
jgi:hypothetical protein